MCIRDRNNNNYIVIQLKSIIDARNLYLVWHGEAQPREPAKLPLSILDVKAFCMSCGRAGFRHQWTFSTFYNLSNEHPSLASANPSNLMTLPISDLAQCETVTFGSCNHSNPKGTTLLSLLQLTIPIVYACVFTSSMQLTLQILKGYHNGQ